MILACFYFSGCATAKKVLPLHDEVLVYELPYDLTYLRALEALNDQPGWELERTDKEKGVIEVRNTQYTRLDDADKRSLTFIVKSIDRTRTSIALDESCQRNLGGGDMLDAVHDRLSAEVR